MEYLQTGHVRLRLIILFYAKLHLLRIVVIVVIRLLNIALSKPMYDTSSVDCECAPASNCSFKTNSILGRCIWKVSTRIFGEKLKSRCFLRNQSRTFIRGEERPKSCLFMMSFIARFCIVWQLLNIYGSLPAK